MNSISRTSEYVLILPLLSFPNFHLASNADFLAVKLKNEPIDKMGYDSQLSSSND